MAEITNIESVTKDRKITLSHYPFSGNRLLRIEKTKGTYESLFGYISPQGARDLIDALEPFAAEKPEPPKVRPLYDQYLELAPGTRFKTNKLATSIFVKIDDDQVVRIRSGETVVMRFDKERGHGGLPHWKTVEGTFSHELEVL